MLKWIKVVSLSWNGECKTEGRLRSDGHWWMWEVSDSLDYLAETKQWLEENALNPSEILNIGTEQEFDNYFRDQAAKRGLQLTVESE